MRRIAHLRISWDVYAQSFVRVHLVVFGRSGAVKLSYLQASLRRMRLLTLGRVTTSFSSSLATGLAYNNRVSKARSSSDM